MKIPVVRSCHSNWFSKAPWSAISVQARWLFVALLLLAPACRVFAADWQSYAGHGLVREIAADRHSLVIQHDAIKGYMMAMTMEFNVQDVGILKGLSAGDEIDFTLDVGQTNSWIQSVQLISHHVGYVPSHSITVPSVSGELRVGDEMPDGLLRGEDGVTRHLSDFRGKALAFTFFFTRCPLPDYCPRMNRNFAATRDLLLADHGSPTNWELLSISFDPDFDSPEVLTSFAMLFRGSDTRQWMFATALPETLRELAAKLDLMVIHEGNSLSHNLRTVVVDARGRISAQFDGNRWTPAQLSAAIRQAAMVQP